MRLFFLSKSTIFFCKKNYKENYFFRYAVILLTLFFSQQSYSATCAASPTTTPTTINFGTYASQNIPAGGISPNGSASSATFSITCSVGLTLQLLSLGSWVRYTTQQPLQLSNGTDTITYTLGSNSIYTPSITAAGQSIGGPSGFNLLSLTVLGAGSITVPLFLKTNATAIWPSAGTYTGTQSLVVDGLMCTGVSVAVICLGTTPISTTVTMSIKLDVSKSCEFISIPALVDFGQISFLSSANTIQLNATLRCTNTEDYLLYVDNGNNYSAGLRHMKSPAGNSIAYDIMQPSSSSLPLNVTNPLSRAGTGVSEAVAIPFKITAGQTTPISGVYTDSVRMVLFY